MKIIITTESVVALNLAYHNKKVDAESLRQNICQILNKSRNKKIKDTLSKEQKKASKEMRQINNNTQVYPFDKGSGFVVLSEGDAIKKIDEQLGKALYKK